jgi:(1->4)-alpha-D-glucan 1-alpha-D-glucosylmutase
MTTPRSTYRLQLHAGFDFDAASKITGYLRELGVSHVYCSPCLEAARGSTHGYDVVNYHRVNPELGGEPARQRFLRALKECGLGQILDIVPNHMAIIGDQNAWWWDTLENGTSSFYARYFDIEWNAPEERLRNRILLPVLEDHSGRVVQAGKLKVERTGGSFLLRYYDHRFPIAPPSMAGVMAQVARKTGNSELGFLADSLDRLPPASDAEWMSLIAHHRDREAIRSLLVRLCEDEPAIGAAIDEAVRELNSSPARLDALLLRQNYRLARWRSATHELVYRRFFDINTLVGVRVEDERVFEDTHALILQWLRCGQLDGVRVDHPDGLRDPKQYFERLRAAAPNAYIAAEKILQPGEEIPAAWNVAGTTGYDFLNLAGSLFVDPRGEATLNELYRDFTGEPVDFAAVAYEKKTQVLREILGSDVNRLTALLVQICEEHPEHRDYTRHEAHEAIRELIARFPVYRTYARAEACEVSGADLEVIAGASEAARSGRPDLDPRLLEFLADILALRVRAPLESELVMRFQQLTAAAMAKGIEDTAFYSYLRLASLNEVGGDPSRFGVSVEEFHQWCAETQVKMPSTMLATSTHDTKRSEDVRVRMSLLSELPMEWADAVRQWSSANAKYRTGEMPDRKTEYLLYQTLAGAWPISRDRLLAYMRKAVREAKEHTNWTEPHQAFEEALEKFVDRVLGDSRFIADLERFLAPLAEPGRVSSLSLALLKLTAPGIPDLYQGTELWDWSLVDPDNRRPVDYDLRCRLLKELEDLAPEQILERREEGLPKLWVIQRALRARNALPHCFDAQGAYRPIWAAGPRAGHVIAFMRGEKIIVAVPRLIAKLENWDDTFLQISAGSWINELTGESLEGGAIPAGALFSRFPVALLTRP